MTLHPVEMFSAALEDFADYPPDVTAVPECLPGTAAFAVSAGLWRPPGSRELPPFPYGGLLVVGHNADSWDNYEKRRRAGNSHGDVVPGTVLMRTWSGLYELLDRAGVELDQFYFTNVLVGLKNGRPEGPFTTYDAPEFKQWCRDFLGSQVTTMRPRVVLVLGAPASRDIAKSAFPPPWPTVSLPPPVAVAARLYGHETVLVPAYHPSRRVRITRDAEALRAAWKRASSGHVINDDELTRGTTTNDPTPSGYERRYRTRPETLAAYVEVWQRSATVRASFKGWTVFARAADGMRGSDPNRVRLAEGYLAQYGYRRGEDTARGARRWVREVE